MTVSPVPMHTMKTSFIWPLRQPANFLTEQIKDSDQDMISLWQLKTDLGLRIEGVTFSYHLWPKDNLTVQVIHTFKPE